MYLYKVKGRLQVSIFLRATEVSPPPTPQWRVRSSLICNKAQKQGEAIDKLRDSVPGPLKYDDFTSSPVLPPNPLKTSKTTKYTAFSRLGSLPPVLRFILGKHYIMVHV